ncbi:hypothetical protein [Companilactobacillus mishanensis]|uniref:Uncharacterized protein n=1 Tax=Companilactobacillus mishanensis TaxID=2486008 RepID=A0A5P0ZGJ4_9LACO|nr:hypothetical protein [Companilactobacillus mishanensis]MQS52180.1 hypothetical protein [Companilactobacillus mishanensis]
MPTYDGSTKIGKIYYGENSVGKEYVGNDLTYSGMLAVGTVLKPLTISIQNDKYGVGIGSTFTFDKIKTDLSNIPNGIKLNWHRTFPYEFINNDFEATHINDETIKIYDDVTKTSSICYIHSEDLLMMPSSVLIKDLKDSDGIFTGTIINKTDTTTTSITPYWVWIGHNQEIVDPTIHPSNFNNINFSISPLSSENDKGVNVIFSNNFAMQGTMKNTVIPLIDSIEVY